MGIFDPLAGQPGLDFIIGDDGGVGAFGDVNGVSQMIAMTVRHQDVVGLNLIGRAGCQRVVAQKRIDQQTALIRFDQKAGMTEP